MKEGSAAIITNAATILSEVFKILAGSGAKLEPPLREIGTGVADFFFFGR